jgi:carbon storage regulator
MVVEGAIMLVLNRKKDERINIGNDITIIVVRTGSGSVDLGIEAPGTLHIRRSELPPREEMRLET